ncbi:hypothetical protein IC582_008390 [Cucumis melo]|uniref:Glycosyltransferase n=2 Tax=Cucumis melo TaxID=3656 RepID=A0A5D3DQW9_CUCMM|nr:UDP-glycosyltransferase 74G1-like [Cucumis melo var. makuwa]TYK26077.1 UDP-glycosyltransferase 74G1-like [Cucumis melo var. makuwa]
MADGEGKTVNNGKKVHILVVTYPAQGHINPLLQFSKRLHHKGAAVTFVITKYLYNNSPAADNPPPFPVETFSDDHDDGGFLSSVSVPDYHERLERVGSESLRDLIRRLEGGGRRIDAVMYDGFMPWVLEVAKEWGLKTVIYFTQMCGVNNIYFHIYKGEIKLLLGGEEEIRMGGMPAMRAEEMPSFVKDVKSCPGFLATVVNQFRNIEEADFLLCNSFYEQEQQVLEWMEKKWRMKTVGPNIPSMYADRQIQDDREYGFNFFKPNDEACRKWLNDRQKKSVVFVAFGSFSTLSAEQMEELAWGLAQTNCFFLWVVRDPKVANVPTKFVEATKEKGLIVPWCLQLEVLSHESIGCFVTHSGWNSTLEALTIGVPMVAMPQWTDQTVNAKFVRDVWKTGIRAFPDHTGIVRRMTIADCILKIMDDNVEGKEIRENAAKWGALARRAVDQGGSSDQNINEVLVQLASGLNI